MEFVDNYNNEVMEEVHDLQWELRKCLIGGGGAGGRERFLVH